MPKKPVKSMKKDKEMPKKMEEKKSKKVKK